MPSFLERYLAGDHIAVWADLMDLRESVRLEPFHADALAVAHETMRRAYHNIEHLIERLRSLGYRFGYEWWNPDYLDMLEGDPPPPVYAPPLPDACHHLDALEARVGPVPLSVRAWYEEVGAVNFVGMYPVQDATDPDGFTCYVQFTRSGGMGKHRRYESQIENVPFAHDLDPLFVDTLEHVLRHFEVTLSHGRKSELDLAPDEWLKYGVSGGGPYVIAMPNPAADAPLAYEWHDTTFVDYLRTCFRWGGFPGLECKARKPEKELAFLTQDLLPI